MTYILYSEPMCHLQRTDLCKWSSYFHMCAMVHMFLLNNKIKCRGKKWNSIDSLSLEIDKGKEARGEMTGCELSQAQ